MLGKYSAPYPSRSCGQAAIRMEWKTPLSRSAYMTSQTDFDPKPAFNAKSAAKRLMREARSGALATLMTGSGHPYCSLVNVATAADGSPLLLISRLAVHTKNIFSDPLVSVMIDERKEGDPLQGARIMLMGTAA